MLKVISTYEFEKLIESISEVDSEEIDILDSHGRVLSEDIISNINIPGFRRSAVDGYAVKSSNTYMCSETMPAILSFKENIEIGKKPSLELADMECSYVPTGGMIPEGADSVVMLEDVEFLGDEALINKSVSTLENVVAEDEDIKKGKEVILKGTTINSTHIAILISLGITKVKVKRQIKVGIISTGDELLSIEENIEIPKIKDTNGPFLTFASREDGCISTHYGILKDVEEGILSAVKKALSENDIVFLSGGSSAGNKDFSEKTMLALGELMFHGLAVKPGKPTLMAKCEGNKYIVGLPGHPLACTIIYKFVISKLIDKMYGRRANKIEQTLEFGENYHKARGREEYLTVTIKDGIAYPIHAKSSAMSVMAKCDGIVKIDRDVEGLQKGDKVKVMR
ncbi:molybdopterin molybdotransferase MoeA [Clostridium cylindrosporum]|uniref:Molybdopterin molybdenumtransferase n=1 Tax=Clostridium cylindrosporum DSM 605 TaxID=1121307 RepID=A0A0J8D9I2_CLOCY|nr:molybdopterin molybdotransferase MoeA [Clostridium cylindrosporum]KMT22700.1 molybdopterin molybdochelatase [Clostridium cylindrosporum DSM 605]